MLITMIFNISTSYFHKIWIHYYKNYLMVRLTLGEGIAILVPKIIAKHL
jgi:hypothetical protein